MIPRLSQLARHLSKPLPNLGHTSSSAASRSASGVASRIMASSSVSADERGRRTLHTAACLIIGDEVLGGKTTDTNSAFMAKWCFSTGIDLKRIEVIADDESEIIEAVRRMSENYDFVVTSGGIGPTHDDITYLSIAKAFGLQLKVHTAAFERMKKLSKPEPEFWAAESPARTARMRMIELPTDETRDLAKQALFPCDDLWVPIAVVNGNIHILPGVPGLFQQLLTGIQPFIIDRLVDPKYRILVSTRMSESDVAAYLTGLEQKVKPKGVSVGSYPRWKKPNTVTLTGRDREYLESLVPELVANVKGKRVNYEGEDDGPEGETA